MISSFAQIPFGTDFKTSSVSMDLKKSTDGELSSNDLIGKVAAQNKDSKVAMSKFIEQNNQAQIVNILSLSSLVGVPGMSIYSSSKYALDGRRLTDSIGK